MEQAQAQIGKLKEQVREQEEIIANSKDTVETEVLRVHTGPEVRNVEV
jgi:hypothetical protein